MWRLLWRGASAKRLPFGTAMPFECPSGSRRCPSARPFMAIEATAASKRPRQANELARANAPRGVCSGKVAFTLASHPAMKFLDGNPAVWENLARTTMKFSIVTPNYNYGRFLKKALECVFTQADAPGALEIEHIVIDGGSTAVGY